MKFMLPLLSLVSFNQVPVHHQESVTVQLDKPTPYKKGHRDQVVMKVYKTALAKVTTDKIIFEGGVVDPYSDWTASYRHARAEQLLTAVLFGECRGQDLTCAYAVGHVALNRARLNMDYRYGRGLYGVLHKRKAFSCLRKVDPSYKPIQRGLAGKLNPHSPDGIKWTVMLGVAHDLMHRFTPDPTRGSTYYHATYVKPKWIKDHGMEKVAQIAGHIFYKKDA